MKNIFSALLFVVVLLHNNWLSNAQRDRRKFVGYTNLNQYTVYNDLKASWIDAYVSCLADGQQLLYIENRAEFEFLRNFLKNNDVPNALREIYWTSGSDYYNEGSFIWMSSGKSIQKLWWSAGNPSNTGSTEHCVTMHGDSDFYLNDDTCSKQLLYICKRPR